MYRCSKMVPARFCIALVVALVVGADAALPAFAVGTFELVVRRSRAVRVTTHRYAIDAASLIDSTIS